MKNFLLIVSLVLATSLWTDSYKSPLAKRIQSGEFIDSSRFFWVTPNGDISSTDKGWSRVPKLSRDYVFLSLKEAAIYSNKIKNELNKEKNQTENDIYDHITNGTSPISKKISEGVPFYQKNFFWINSKLQIKSTDRGYSRVPKQNRNLIYLTGAEAQKALDFHSDPEKLLKEKKLREEQLKREEEAKVKRLARRKETERIAEVRRQEAERIAEVRRQEAERLAEARRQEAERLAEDRRPPHPSSP